MFENCDCCGEPTPNLENDYGEFVCESCEQNAAEAAYERHCEAFHDGGATQFKSLQQQQIEARRAQMNSQMEGDKALAEHRAVMAALMKACISRPTQEEYDRVLSRVSEEMQCPETTQSPSLSPSSEAS